MDERRSQLQQLLTRRSGALAERWYDAIAHSSFTPHPAAEIRHHLLALTRRAIAALLAEPFDDGAGMAIGIALANLRYLDAEALRWTLGVLGTGLGSELPPGDAAFLQPRITVFLAALAAGYVGEVRTTILAEQGLIHAALLAERGRIMMALRESESRFRAIFAGAAIGIVLADVEGRPVESNPAIERMLGYTRDELHGMVFTAVTHPDDVLTDWEHFEDLVAGRRDAYQMEKRYLHKDGHIVWGNLTVSLVRDEQGTPQFTIGMVEDITAHKRMRADLAEAQRWLAESREMERLRLARELHDSALQDLLDINRHLDETRRRAGERHEAAVPIATVAAVQQKVREITAQLRALLRELRPPGLEEFGLIAALEGYVADLQRERPDMPAVVLDMRDEETVLPLAVSLPLFRAAQEALRNGLEHAQAQHLTLSLRVDIGEAVLSVRDDGVGFAIPSSLGTLAREGHFGLVGIAERVALAGGELDIASRPGEDTVITVQIPVVRQGRNGGGDDSGPDRG